MISFSMAILSTPLVPPPSKERILRAKKDSERDTCILESQKQSYSRYSTAQHSTVQYNTVQLSKVQYSTV